MGQRLTRRRFVEATGAALAAAYAIGPPRAATAAAQATVAVPGLSAPGEIIVDRWGIPHIYAATQPDAFRLQGFNAARDRLWQIDLWRRRGLGRLSAVLGRSYLEQDRAARLFLYRGDLAREYAAYGDDAEQIATAFAEGVNAYVDQVERGAAPLPVEFAALGYRPERWAAEDVVRIRSHGLVSNLSTRWTGRSCCGSSAARPRRCASGSSPAGATRSPRGSTSTPSPRTCSTSTSWRSRPSSSPSAGGCRVAPRARAAGLEQLDDRAPPHGDRPPDPGQRPASGPGRAVAALPRAPRRPGPQRDRRRRAGPARHLHRPQRAHRLRADDLRDRPGGPLRLRDARGEAGRVPLSRRLGADDRRRGGHPGQGRRAASARRCASPGTAR